MRDVCVMTSSRADFGLLCPVMKGIEAAPDLRLHVAATGSHLCGEFGATIDAVLEAGFDVEDRVEILVGGDTPAAVCKSMGLAMIGFGELFARRRPHLLLLLGDRFETLCAAAAAQVHCVPIAHIHGGERSEGAVDDAFRHAITKMSHLHFTSCEAHRRRVIQLGERPEHVFNVGALGVENARRTTPVSRAELARSLGLPAGRPLIVVTFHPVTRQRGSAAGQLSELLAAMEAFPDHCILFTGANADAEGRALNGLIRQYAEDRPGRAVFAASLAAEAFLAAMRHADVVVGNSSSGLIEAPALRVPSVNVGDRQLGRAGAPSVIDCAPSAPEIVEAVRAALRPSFRASIASMEHPCERPGTAATIVRHLREARLEGILCKPFVDLPAPGETPARAIRREQDRGT